MNKIVNTLGVRLVVMIAIFVAVGLGLNYVRIRADLSRGRAYTLSDSTTNVVRNLKKDVTITFFTSSNLPSQVLPVKRDVADLLGEYARGSNGRVKIKNVVIAQNATVQEKAAADYGIAPRQISQRERDTFAVLNIFFGIGIESDGKKQSIGDATNLGNLEYNITSMLYKMQSKALPTVGIIGSGGGGIGSSSITNLRTVLGSQFEVEESASASAKMNAAIIVDDGQTVYDKTQVDQVRKYVAGGGNMLMFVGGVSLGQGSQAQIAGHGLFGLLREWGIDVQKDLLLSQQAEFANLGAQEQGFQVVAPYPFWIQTNVINQATPYFGNVAILTLPWASSLKIDEKKAMDVVRTSDQSWILTSNFDIDPSQIQQPKEKQLKSYVVAAVTKPSGKAGRVFVVSSPHMIQDQFNSQRIDNLELALNVLTDFASQGALVGIRQRSINVYPLPNLGANEKDAFKYAMILLLPALWSIYGFWRLHRRK